MLELRRIRQNLVEFGRIWQNLAEFGLMAYGGGQMEEKDKENSICVKAKDALRMMSVGCHGKTFLCYPAKISIFIIEDVQEHCSKTTFLQLSHSWEKSRSQSSTF